MNGNTFTCKMIGASLFSMNIEIFGKIEKKKFNFDTVHSQKEKVMIDLHLLFA